MDECRHNIPHTLDMVLDPWKVKENPTAAPEVLQILKIIRPDWKQENIRAKVAIYGPAHAIWLLIAFSSNKCLGEPAHLYRLARAFAAHIHKVLTAGFSNFLFGFYEEGKFSEDVILFRIHKEAAKRLVDRTQERKYMKMLSSVGFGAPLYAIFNNGMVHGYIHGEILDLCALREEKIRKLIIQEMCRLHNAIAIEDPSDRSQWKQLGLHMFGLAPDGFPNDPEKQKRLTEEIPPKNIIRQELDELWKHTDALHSPVVFCHNDMSHSNIIYNKDKDCVYFIDYEYAMFNCEHYETAHHFCYMAGIGQDGIDILNYPDKQFQLRWIRDYLMCKATYNGAPTTEVTDDDVETYYVKANKFALEFMLILGIGGLVEARFITDDSFDYIRFSKGMFDAYFHKKKEFLSLKEP